MKASGFSSAASEASRGTTLRPAEHERAIEPGDREAAGAAVGTGLLVGRPVDPIGPGHLPGLAGGPGEERAREAERQAAEVVALAPLLAAEPAPGLRRLLDRRGEPARSRSGMRPAMPSEASIPEEPGAAVPHAGM